MLYASGRGVGKDYTKAIEWYEKAADAGCSWAMKNLGIYYLHGAVGLEKNLDMAHEWLEKAIAAGDTGAYSFMGDYFTEINDPENAKIWYEKAAEQ